MSSKIGVFHIIRNHYETYQDIGGKTSYSDWLVMVALPLVIAIIAAFFGLFFSSAAYTNIITAGAIFTGLLLNLLILVYDQKTKLLQTPVKGDEPTFKQFSTRKRVIEEVHHNISYCILVSLFAVVFATIGSLDINQVVTIPKIDVTIKLVVWIVNLPLVFLCIHTIFTILMILKRVHLLVESH